MLNFIKSIWKVFKRELSLIHKDKDIFILILIAPLFYAFFYNSLYINKTETKIPVAVVDMDKSGFSRDFIKKLDSHELTSVKYVFGEINEAHEMLNRMVVQGVIVIYPESELNLKLRKGITISSNLNTTRFLVSNDRNKAVNDVAFSFGNSYKQIYFQTIGYNSSEAKTLVEPVTGDVRPMFNLL